jgi:hypothetical protein
VSTPTQRLKSRRQARWRERQKRGEVAITLSLPEIAIATALIETRRLSPQAALDRGAVRDALTTMLVDWAAAWAEHVC